MFPAGDYTNADWGILFSFLQKEGKKRRGTLGRWVWGVGKTGGGVGGWGGFPCRMSIIRNGNVALPILRKCCVALSNFKKALGHPVDFKTQCHAVDF